MPWLENPPWSGFDLLIVTAALLAGTVVFSAISVGVLMTTPQFRGTNIRAITEHPSMYIVVPAMGAAYAVMLAVLYVLAVARQQPFWKSLSWNWPQGRKPAAFLGGGAALSIVAGMLQKILPTPKNLPIEDMFREPGAAWFLATLGVVIAPFVEEILFRGLLYPVANRWLVDVLHAQRRTRRGRLVFLFLVPWGFAAHMIPPKLVLLMSCGIFLGIAVVSVIRAIPGNPTASRMILPGLAFLVWGQLASHLAERGLLMASLGLLLVVVAMTVLGLQQESNPLPTRVAIGLSVVTTAAAFAMVHGEQLGQSWSPLLVLFVVGTVLTLTRAATKSVASSFLVHLGYNFTLFGLLYLATDQFRHMERMPH
jgi:membrane protease YdiL (CAAX protease family)